MPKRVRKKSKNVLYCIGCGKIVERKINVGNSKFVDQSTERARCESCRREQQKIARQQRRMEDMKGLGAPKTEVYCQLAEIKVPSGKVKLNCYVCGETIFRQNRVEKPKYLDSSLS